MKPHFYLIPATILCFLFFQGCKKKREDNANFDLNSLILIDSGVAENLISSIDEQITVGDFLILLGLVAEDDHWEEALGIIRFNGREVGVDYYSILGGGVEFTTRYSDVDEKNFTSYYSQKTLEKILSSFTYSVRGKTYTKILVDGIYVNPK
jgi:hypothetical protein